MTMAFLTLSMVEMFHSFNMRSRRQSVFSLRGQNWWLWGAFLVSLLLTFLVIEIPFLANMFSFTILDPIHYGMAMGLAFLIIPIMELYKAIMRAVEK
jgi:Ca2+-transporting ATPase